MRFLGLIAALCFASALIAAPVRAEDPAVALIELTFVPTDLAQIVVWAERIEPDGKHTFMGTLGLTYAVASAGIGNRPGALQMNSGYRWPYGRREGVLPVWAHRRAEAPGAKQFKRVIFQNRSSEGAASRTANDQSVDDYYCLSFDRETTGREALDAVTCASVFSSDKGRFITQKDVSNGYAEPFESEPAVGEMRALSLYSLYPPRRNAQRCAAAGCFDHPDVDEFRSHATSVMPELDAISQATPAGNRTARWLASVPADWPADADYELYIEVNVEGDYNDEFSAARYPTPRQPSGRWDTWAEGYGYAYRGQPSVVYSIPFRIDRANDSDTSEPVGFGSVHGEDGKLRPMADDMITDNPEKTPGSGADRLRLTNGARASLRVTQGDPCKQPDPPKECGLACDPESDSCGELVCGDDGTCQSVCLATDPPKQVTDLRVSEYPTRVRSHMWARLSFRVPASERPITAYEVRVRPKGGSWEQAYTNDEEEELLPVALDVCADPEDPMRNRCPSLEPGYKIDEIDITGLQQSTDYEFSVAARDGSCNMLGPVAYASFRTPAREFTTVSPCFVATAAYGSPLAAEIGVLRQVRDRYLASHGLGRALIDVYYSFGPSLADVIGAHEWLRGVARTLLSPIVALSRWWLS